MDWILWIFAGFGVAFVIMIISFLLMEFCEGRQLDKNRKKEQERLDRANVEETLNIVRGLQLREQNRWSTQSSSSEIKDLRRLYKNQALRLTRLEGEFRAYQSATDRIANHFNVCHLLRRES